ncbi:class I SAM-dependent methyltransferase, partial [Bacteroidota bacterium]
KSYYKDNYKLTNEDNIGFEKRRIFRIPEQIELISIISKYKEAPAKILDIGCDRGFFLDEARRYGYDGCGIEPLDEAREYCTRTGINVFGSLSELDFKSDIITMWHSLEHHPNPKDALDEIWDYINDDGFIFIRVPAFDCFWRKIFGEKWIWFQPENHYFHFTLQSIRKILQLSGYNLIELTHRKPNNNFTKSFNRLSNKTFSRFFGSKTNLRKKVSRFYQDLTGVEIFAVAKKNKTTYDNLIDL